MYRWLRATVHGEPLGVPGVDNAIRNHGPIGGLLQSEWTGSEWAARLGLANSRWDDLAPREAGGIISAAIAARPEIPALIHGHYVMRGLGIRQALPDADVVDIMPSRRHVWLCHALQMRKEYTKRLTTMPQWLRDLPGSAVVEASLSRHGWFPAFWARAVSDGLDVNDIDGLFVGISTDAKNTDDGEEWLVGSRFVLDAAEWLLGDGPHHEDLCRAIGIGQRPELAAWVRGWKSSNRALLTDMGVTDDMLNASMDGTEQERVVADLLRRDLEELNLLAV